MSLEEFINEILEHEGEYKGEERPPPKAKVSLEMFPYNRVLFSGFLSTPRMVLPLLINRPPIGAFDDASPLTLLRTLIAEWKYMVSIGGEVYKNTDDLHSMSMGPPIVCGYVVIGDTLYIVDPWRDVSNPVYLMVRGDVAVVRKPEEAYRVTPEAALEIVTAKLNSIIGDYGARVRVWVDLKMGEVRSGESRFE